MHSKAAERWVMEFSSVFPVVFPPAIHYSGGREIGKQAESRSRRWTAKIEVIGTDVRAIFFRTLVSVLFNKSFGNPSSFIITIVVDYNSKN